jgi:hypothetical protein
VKRVLALAYSQTGQLSMIAGRMLQPLCADARCAVQLETLVPRREFPFPWPLFRFLDAFPESALLAPGELQPLSIAADDSFDLIVLFYQVWFLAPSQPVTAFLQSPQARRLLAGKPVITVIACRNMWMMAHTHMSTLLARIGARHLDNVVLSDRGATLATLLTTPLWLLTGRRRCVPGLPAAGVSARDIDRGIRFGRALRDALAADRERGPGPLLAGLGAVTAQPGLLVSERAGTRSFRLWGRLLRRAGPPGAWQRRPLLGAYLVFLVALILTVVPLSLCLQTLLRPLLRRRLARIKQDFEQPSGSGLERLALYDQ